jgi:hypothetical protein
LFTQISWGNPPTRAVKQLQLESENTVTTRPATVNGIALGRTHARRLRDVYRSAGWLELALQRLQTRHPALPVWSQQRQMGEASRHTFLQQFDVAGQGIGFAVLGGVTATRVP